jgi:NAD(P)-dependent dehydrogenase (short-subunit alcohol dehydrogenase family)
MRLEGKVCVITGGGAGLGRASALLFAEEGASVVVGSRDAARVEATVEDIRRSGGTAIGRQIDVSVERDVADLVDAAVAEFGRLDVMFNNAAVPPPGNGRIPFEEIADDEWQRLVGVNLSGVFYGCKHAIGPMKEAGGGSIVNSSSGAAFAANPGWAAYAATKGAINALTRGLAVDLGPYNIRVNAVCPAVGVSANFHQPPGSPVVDDDQLGEAWNPEESNYPLRVPRPPRLRDSALLALFLASDESAYISGQAIAVDAALLARMADAFKPEYRARQRDRRERAEAGEAGTTPSGPRAAG